MPIYSSKFPSSLKEEINNLNSLKKLVVKEKNSIFLIGPGAGVNQLTKKRTKSRKKTNKKTGGKRKKQKKRYKKKYKSKK